MPPFRTINQMFLKYMFTSILAVSFAVGKASCTVPADGNFFYANHKCHQTNETKGTALPQTMTVSVVNITGTVIGTLNGYGNFSSPGPSYPFRTYPDDEGFSRLVSYSLSPCLDEGLLSCAGNAADSTASFYVSLKLPETEPRS